MENEKLQKLIDAIKESFTKLAEAICIFVEALRNAFKFKFFDCFLNRRLWHLALYSKKKRVRKKNIRRSTKILSRYNL